MPVLTETQWHGNPRPVEQFAWTATGPVVTSPYTGEDEATYWHGVGEEKYEAVGLAVTQDQDVRLTEGSILVSGTVKAGDFFSVNWLTWGELGDAVARGASGTFSRDLDANQAAVQIGSFISGNIDTYGSAVGPLVVMTPTAGQTEIQVGISTYTPA